MRQTSPRFRHLAIGVVAVFGMQGLTSASAETLQIAPAAARVAGSLPERGQSMAVVEARFGAPLERVAAIGQPPITRWRYAGFTVVFEHQHVVHAIPAGTTLRVASVGTASASDTGLGTVTEPELADPN